MWKKLRSRKGSTLLEVMVAVAVVSIALVPIVTVVLGGVDTEDYVKKLGRATMIADEKLRQIEEKGIPGLGSEEGLVDREDPGGFSYRLVVSESAIDKVRKAEIEVSWDKKRGTVKLVQYIAER